MTHVMIYLVVFVNRNLGFRDQVDHTSVRARKGVIVMRVMAAAHREQRLLVLVCYGLVFSVIEYALAILTLSKTKPERFSKI